MRKVMNRIIKIWTFLKENDHAIWYLNVIKFCERLQFSTGTFTCKASRFSDIHLLKDSKETMEGLSISTVMLGTIDVGVGWKKGQ